MNLEMFKEGFDYITIDGKILEMFGSLEDLWFSAAEIGHRLIDWSYGPIPKMINKVLDNDKAVVPKPNGLQWFISERGLLYLLMQCDKPNAERYREVIIDILNQRRRLFGQNAKEFWEEVGNRVSKIRGAIDLDDPSLRISHACLIPNFESPDGICVVLGYSEGKLQNVVTRGNGLDGLDITSQASMIDSVPKEVNTLDFLYAIGLIKCPKAKRSDILQILSHSITFERFSFEVCAFLSGPRSFEGFNVAQSYFAYVQ